MEYGSDGLGPSRRRIPPFVFSYGPFCPWLNRIRASTSSIFVALPLSSSSSPHSRVRCLLRRRRGLRLRPPSTPHPPAMDVGSSSASAVDTNSYCNVDAASRSASTVDAAFSSVMAGTGSSCSHQRKALPLIQCLHGFPVTCHSLQEQL